MTQHILFHDIDEPGLNTLAVYERRGGYESLRKAMALQPQQITDELLESLEHELAEDPDVYVRHFECLGACDIAPMASIDGIYVGPIELEEVPVLAQQIRNGEAPLPDKQILRRASTDPTANTREFPRPNPLAQRAVPDASIPVRPPEQGSYGEQMPGDQPGPSAPLEDR